MAIKRVESFDHWVTADAAKKGWSFGGANATISAGNGRNGTAAFRCLNPSAAGGATLGVSGGTSTGVVGFAFRCSGLPVSDVPIVSVKEGSTTHVSVTLMAGTGALRIYLAGSTTLATSAGGVVTGGTWVFLEFAWTCHNSAGTVNVRANGVSVASASGIDTQSNLTGIWTGILLMGAGSSSSTYQYDIDDLYLADDLTFRGDHRIVCVVASSGNGSNTAWTPSTGTDHGALVDDATPNTSDYVTSNTAGAIDTFNFAALGVSGTVAGVQTCHYTKCDVAGVRTVVPAYRIGGVNYAGTGAVLGSDWQYQTEFAATSPATSVAWTVAEIDAAEFGVKVTV